MTHRYAGIIAGLVVFAVLLALPAPGGMSDLAWRAAAAGILMAIWWITEAVPISATALLPLVLFPMLGVADITAAAAPYANPLIFLFLGGFLIAQAMQKWGLHRRIALGIMRALGARPSSIVLGFMIATAFLSMWVSNTATALMMLPIAASVIELVRTSMGNMGTARDGKNFSVVVLLAIAYSSSIGGMATLIGTPVNALLAGFMDEAYGFRIGFAQWMLVGVPLMIVGLAVTYAVLTRVAFPFRLPSIPGGRALLQGEYERLGRTSPPERRVAAVFALVAALWMGGPLLQPILPGLSDPGIAVGGALLLFVLPAGAGTGESLLDWTTAQGLPWGVLLLFGGGLSLAAGIQDSGLAVWIGEQMHAAGAWPLLFVLLAVISVVILLTELTSNTATAAAFLPIVAAVAVGIGRDPLILAVPAALAASCAFMLPVATPPNAIVYGTGDLTIPQMARAGVWLNVIFIGLITGLTYSFMAWAFGLTTA